ncbi:nicotinate-nucleotide adenylyltransferase [Litorimonas sp. RW-G-Af-16]|uniref:nicotinate-nucleotide adenylyltransferase n=1 Tax=Litorimonas sp. RW-G-Af-16 TaxID=3241168 RepID=UPI003AAD6545
MRLEDNQSIGLFGGSFNPAHAGHMHVAEAGLRELGLDRIWWLVSPQNPLKPRQPSYASRAKTVRNLPLKPRMQISEAEQDIGSNYTIDLIRGLQQRYPLTRFVFLMGADNFAQLPRWKNWQEIMARVPIAVIARPQSPIRARLGQVARQYADARIPEAQAHQLQFYSAPCWTYLTLPLHAQSSSAIRAQTT